MPLVNSLPAQRSYQSILEEEYNRHYPEGDDSNPVGLEKPETLLTEDEITDLIDVPLEDFLDDGLLIEYSDIEPTRYRSTHFDLIYRLNNVRTRRENQSSVFESYLSKESELVPNFGSEPLTPTLEGTPTTFSPRTLNLLATTLKQAGDDFDVENISTLSSHQRAVIEDLLEPSTDNVSLSAPTAAGKTITFLTPALGAALEALTERPHRHASILVYPRNALARDQFSKILARVEMLNDLLPDGEQLTIGIEDGDTLGAYDDPTTHENDQYEPGDSFRGFECVKHDCSGDLVVLGNPGPTVTCSSCEYEYSSIKPTKNAIWDESDQPNILLTNPYTLYNRVLTPGQVERFEHVQYYAFDEAHVYTSYTGGHIQYIISILRDLAQDNGGDPTFVFSSATMSNPEEFVRSLAAIGPDEPLAYQDYHETLAEAGVDEKRLLFRLYLLPSPQRSVEGLNQLLVEATALWCHRNNFKAINFIDSVSEVNRQHSFVRDTILGPNEYEGREVLRHLQDDSLGGPGDWFSWQTLAPDLDTTGSPDYQHFATGALRDSISRHYAGLSPNERTAIEDAFAGDELRFLFSTQTLELGIDLDDVAAVLQYKLPRGGNEGVIQRIGRAGRSRETQRVGLGIVALSSKPTSMLYMYNSNLRSKLESSEHLPPAKIGTSAAVRKQHLLSRALVNIARDGHTTYFMRQSISTTDQLMEVLSTLRREIRGFTYRTTGSISKMMGEDEFDHYRHLLLDHLDRILDGSDSAVTTDIDVNPDQLFSRIDRLYNEIHESQTNAQNIIRTLRSIEDPPTDIILDLVSATEPLRTLEENLRTLKEAVRGSWRANDAGEIQDWLGIERDTFLDAAENIPSSDKLRKIIYSKFMIWASETYGNVIEFEEETGVNVDHVTTELIQAVEHLGDSGRESFEQNLSEVLRDVERLSNEDLRALSSHFAIQSFESMDQDGFISLFDALNAMLENSVRFTTLLEPPEPEFRMEVR